MIAKTILQVARDYLGESEDRWARGGMPSSATRRCLVASINAAIFAVTYFVAGSILENGDCLAAYVAIGKVLDVQIDELAWGRPIVEWNDDPKRTYREVLAVLDTAIGAA